MNARSILGIPTLCGDYHYFQKYIWSHLNVVHCVLSLCQIRYKFVLYLINSFLNQITANVERNISNSLYKIIRRSVHISDRNFKIHFLYVWFFRNNSLRSLFCMIRKMLYSLFWTTKKHKINRFRFRFISTRIDNNQKAHRNRVV